MHDAEVESRLMHVTSADDTLLIAIEEKEKHYAPQALCMVSDPLARIDCKTIDPEEPFRMVGLHLGHGDPKLHAAAAWKASAPQQFITAQSLPLSTPWLCWETVLAPVLAFG